jgi:hypothetical protein
MAVEQVFGYCGSTAAATSPIVHRGAPVADVVGAGA